MIIGELLEWTTNHSGDRAVLPLPCGGGEEETLASRHVFVNPLSMNHQAKPKLKNSKTQISEFMSFGLLRPLNRKKPFLISHDFGISGSWFQCASDGWKWRLPTNRKVGLGVLTPPPGMLDTSDWPRRGEDTQPYPPLAVQGFKARSFVSENSHLDPLPSSDEGRGNLSAPASRVRV